MTKPAPGEIAAAVAGQAGWAAKLFDELRAGSADVRGVTRASYGPGEQFAAGLFAARAEAMKLDVERDDAANLYMYLRGRDRAAPRIVIGSHMDSVPRGGNFDGAAGVAAGLTVQRALQALGVTPACDIAAMGIRAEESYWFETSYIGSRAAFGVLGEEALACTRVDTGRSLAEHIDDCGGNARALRDHRAYLKAEEIRAFIELHIEQAPQLVEAGKPMAVGTGVPGKFRFPYVDVIGEYNHVGTPRRFRKDSVVAASEFVAGLDAIWEAHEDAGRPMAFNVGRFYTDAEEHGLVIVAGKVTFSLDVRAYTVENVTALENQVFALADRIGRRRGVRFDFGTRTYDLPGPSDPAIQSGLLAACAEMDIPVQLLPSPAGHDTATFVVEGVPSCMVFVRNENGSHNPHERMEIDDFLSACAAITGWVVDVAGT